MLARRTIKVRIYLVFALTVAAVCVSLSLGLWALRSQMLADRKAQLGSRLELALSVASGEMNAAGGPTSELGRKAFFRVLQNARLSGAGEESYIFAHSHDAIAKGLSVPGD